MSTKINKISTNLWFDTQAEEAVKFYTSIFKNSKIGRIARYGKERHNGYEEGKVMTIEFQLEGVDFVALNGGPVYHFTKLFLLSLIVKTKKKSTIIGRGYQKVQMKYIKYVAG